MNKMKILLKLIIIFLIFQNFSSAETSQKVDKISKNLRCLICQGQSVYDSQSDFALSMKILIQNKIDEGKNDEQIYDFLKNKYGEWIVYDPEINKNTILLWVLPLILFVFGGILIYRKVSIK
jgi:cytochrome c-type biogenesis protein CcmH